MTTTKKQLTVKRKIRLFAFFSSIGGDNVTLFLAGARECVREAIKVVVNKHKSCNNEEIAEINDTIPVIFSNDLLSLVVSRAELQIVRIE